MADAGDGWEAHARAQRRAWLHLSYAERLAWLEEAKAFVALTRSAPRSESTARQAGPGPDPPAGQRPEAAEE